MRQNIKILSKLDVIISNQKALENKVSKVEESVDKNNNDNQGDEEYIKVRPKNTNIYVNHGWTFSSNSSLNHYILDYRK